MPLTTIDPNTALIVIDLQKGIASGNFIHPIGEVVERTRALIDVFRAKRLLAGNHEWMDSGRGDMKHRASIGEYKANLFHNLSINWQKGLSEIGINPWAGPY